MTLTPADVEKAFGDMIVGHLVLHLVYNAH
jgi:hypothetical protein